MKLNKTKVIVETAFSEDDRKRYFLKKVWDTDKPIPIVVSKSAGADDGVFETLTQTLLTNNLYQLGYGGFCLCNLFAGIGSRETDADNLKVIQQLCKTADYKEIICCWGNLENAAEDVQKEAGSVIGILTASKKALLAVSDGEHRNCHPLSPSVRKYFELVPYDVKGGKQE